MFLLNFYRNSYINHIKRFIRLSISLIILILLSSCSKELDSNTIIYNNDQHSMYGKVLEEIFPSYIIEQGENKAYYTLDNGNISEGFDSQAVGALETGIAKYWYPQYLATVIIAVDRDRSTSRVSSWTDLLGIEEEIGFSDSPGNAQMLTAAMSYGLEGEEYSLTKAIELLGTLNDEKRLKINSFEAPVIICYDYQAAALINSGRNIEMIIPDEGSFTYEKGLLSNKKLVFGGNENKLLLESKFRLLDGRSDSSIYPSRRSYLSASRINDYKHFATSTRKVNCLIQRQVLNSKKAMSIDNREHLHFALIYIIIITIWIASIINRSMQKGVSYAAFFTGVILSGWIFIRLIKYQIELNSLASRYLWYSFYIFQLTLPLVLLWMAWAIDKPEDKIFPPKWWKGMLILSGILIVLVFTNDLHGLVLELDLTRPDWDINYAYGFGYYIILSVCMLNLIVVFAILLKKGIRNPRKKAFIFPVLTFIMFAIYNYKYIVRDPLFYATDLTIVTGIFTMLMFEVCIRSRLIPVNTKYVELFTESPLKMKILNKEGEVVLASKSSSPLENEKINKILLSSPISIIQDDGYSLLANPIPGGHAIWHDDVSKLYNLHMEVYESTKMLTEANNILMEEKKLKRSINEKKAKKQLIEQLELEIAKSIEDLKNMIEKLPYSKEKSKEGIRIALLLCYIKRRCNLFFQEKESNLINLNQLILYIDELIEISKYIDFQVVSINKVEGKIDIRHARLFYDSFYMIVGMALERSCPYIIVDFEKDEEFLSMRFLPAEDIGTSKEYSKLALAIVAVNGKIERKVLEDTVGINISFPKGGVFYD